MAVGKASDCAGFCEGEAAAALSLFAGGEGFFAGDGLAWDFGREVPLGEGLADDFGCGEESRTVLRAGVGVGGGGGGTGVGVGVE